MKHQQEILSQRLANAQSAIKSANYCLAKLQNIIKSENDIEKVIEEIEEIKDFLNWAVNQ